MSNVHMFARTGGADEEEAHLRQEAVDAAHRALTHGVDGLRNFPIFLSECFERRAWENDRVFAGGTKQGPIAFREFVHQPYPVGLGTTFDAIEKLIRGDNKLIALWTEVTKRKPGEGQARDPETGQMLPSVDNIHERIERPSGTSAEAGLRKLQKASAEGNEDAARELAAVLDGAKKVHTACVDAGLRKSSRIDADVKARCSKSVAEWIVERAGQDDLSGVVSDLFSVGAKSIAIEIKNLIGESSTMDARWGTRQ